MSSRTPRQARSRLGPVLLEIATRLPWWVSIAIAIATFLVLRAVAGLEPVSATGSADLGAVISQGMIRAMAMFGQFVFPVIFVIGAIASVLGKRSREKLVTQVADSSSAASLGHMTWSEFEALVQEAFSRKGYAVQRIGGAGPDGGVDLVLDRGTERALVQCKQWRAQRVGVSVVRELYGVMAAQGAAAGFVVTSGSFTPDALEFARGRNIQLIAGPELFEMIRDLRISTPTGRDDRRAPLSAAVTGPAQCPVCSGPMVERRAKRGANAGNMFLGCNDYPSCRGTRPLQCRVSSAPTAN